ncbi:hypothetical protein DUNSADRAFT_7991, partial [Dunaliella salina]
MSAVMSAMLRAATQEVTTLSAAALAKDAQLPSAAEEPHAAAALQLTSGAAAAAAAAASSTGGRVNQAGPGGTLNIPVLVHSANPPLAHTSPYFLSPQPRGALSSLVPKALAAAQPGELTVAVRAVGLNFRDVLNVLGMYPGDPGDPGGDCSGVVVGGAGHAPGTPVFGLAVGSLGTCVHCSPLTMVPLPPGCVSFEEAATMPTVFSTVHMVLSSATALAAGEAVFLPAAAGGVGLAALQLARAQGAKLVATAGSPSKRALLRGLG